MRYLSEKLKRVTLLLQRIACVAVAQKLYFCCVNLKGLLGVRCYDQSSGYLYGAAGEQLGYVRVVAELVRFVYNLTAAKAGAVIQGNKAYLVIRAVSPYPALDGDRRSVAQAVVRHKPLDALINFINQIICHRSSPSPESSGSPSSVYKRSDNS